MKWTVIVRVGKELNVTLASILYDKWGAKTQQQVIVCDDWLTGYQQAKEEGNTHALFVDSGTVWKDWHEWKALLETYPHNGLIGHIIAHENKYPTLHTQCWFMELDLWPKDNKVSTSCVVPVRSENNLHDDYTPLWLKPSSTVQEFDISDLGQQLIAQQLTRGKPVVNWNNQARDIKKFLYKNNDQLEIFKDYIDLAENQLWVLNNEPIEVIDSDMIVCPASGLFWIANIVRDNCCQMHLVDISGTQLDLARNLWNSWDGKNYGEFVWQFIKKHKVQHFQLDRIDIDKVERIRLSRQNQFVEYVNKVFESVLNSLGIDPDDFVENWMLSRRNKSIFFHKNNLISWVLENNTPPQQIWASNILNYKWTMLHTSPDDCLSFRKKIS